MVNQIKMMTFRLPPAGGSIEALHAKTDEEKKKEEGKKKKKEAEEDGQHTKGKKTVRRREEEKLNNKEGRLASQKCLTVDNECCSHGGVNLMRFLRCLLWTI